MHTCIHTHTHTLPHSHTHSSPTHIGLLLENWSWNGHRSLLGFASKCNVIRQILGKLNLYEHPLYTLPGFSSVSLTGRILSWRFQEGVRGTKVYQKTSFDKSGGPRYTARSVEDETRNGHRNAKRNPNRNQETTFLRLFSNFQKKRDLEQ